MPRTQKSDLVTIERAAEMVGQTADAVRKALSKENSPWESVLGDDNRVMITLESALRRRAEQLGRLGAVDKVHSDRESNTDQLRLVIAAQAEAHQRKAESTELRAQATALLLKADASDARAQAVLIETLLQVVNGQHWSELLDLGVQAP
jgi:hypothetical protein